MYPAPQFLQGSDCDSFTVLEQQVVVANVSSISQKVFGVMSSGSGFASSRGGEICL